MRLNRHQQRGGTMDDNEDEKGKLPGNHGQFGVNNATEDYKPLEDHPNPAPAPEPPQQTHAGDRS